MLGIDHIGGIVNIGQRGRVRSSGDRAYRWCSQQRTEGACPEVLGIDHIGSVVNIGYGGGREVMSIDHIGV